MSNTNPARGMRDFLPSDVRKREYVIGIIKEVYESYGFEPLETPAVENIETLMGKYGEEGNQLIFKILKRGEKLDESLNARQETGDERRETSDSDLTSQVSRLSDLALRYDLTVPLARVVANRKNDLPKFFKRYQIQPVWRADRPARGRFREFYQCDVDAIGSKSMVVEAELISAVSEILTRLGFKGFYIQLNNRKLLTGILEVAGVPNEKHTDALVALDKLDKIDFQGVIKEFFERGIGDSGNKVIQLFLELTLLIAGAGDQVDSSNDNPTPYADKINAAIIEKLQQYCGSNITAAEGIREIQEVLEISRSLNQFHRILVFPKLARGLSYYSGSIMEISVQDLPSSLAGGGRYDGLIGMFGKEQIPACGFSLGLERILVVMDERGMFPPEIAANTPADVMVTIWNEESIGKSLRLANELREHKFRVLLYPEPDKLGKQFKYASQSNIPWVCVLGESELAENKVTLKNMQTGEQETLPRNEIAASIHKTS